MKVVKPFSETDVETAKFPAMDLLFENLEEIDGLMETYISSIDEVVKYYEDTTKQILPGEMVKYFYWDRYTDLTQYKIFIKSLRNLVKNLDGFLLAMMNTEVEFRFDRYGWE